MEDFMDFDIDEEILNLLLSFEQDDVPPSLSLEPLYFPPQAPDGSEMTFIHPPAPVGVTPPPSNLSSWNGMPNFGMMAYDSTAGAVVFTPLVTCTPLVNTQPAAPAPPPPPPSTVTPAPVHQIAIPVFQKTGLALQRERTGSLNLGDLSPHFNLPIGTAASRLNLCTTALKQVCRRNGVPRWPYRKVKSTETAIARLLSGKGGASSSRGNQGGALSAKVIAEIERLQDERAKACEGWEGRLRRSEAEIRRLVERLRGEYGRQAEATRAQIDELYKIVAECQAQDYPKRSRRPSGK